MLTTDLQQTSSAFHMCRKHICALDNKFFSWQRARSSTSAFAPSVVSYIVLDPRFKNVVCICHVPSSRWPRCHHFRTILSISVAVTVVIIVAVVAIVVAVAVAVLLLLLMLLLLPPLLKWYQMLASCEVQSTYRSFRMIAKILLNSLRLAFWLSLALACPSSC